MRPEGRLAAWGWWMAAGRNLAVLLEGQKWSMEQVRWAAVLIFLAVSAVSDIRTRQISLALTAVAGISGLLCAWGDESCDMKVLFWQLLPGLILMAAAFLSRGRAGMGDALTMLACAGFLRGNEGLTILATASLSAAVWSGILLARGRKGNVQIPFVPFLLIGAVTALLLETCG